MTQDNISSNRSD